MRSAAWEDTEDPNLEPADDPPDPPAEPDAEPDAEPAADDDAAELEPPRAPPPHGRWSSHSLSSAYSPSRHDVALGATGQ